MIPRPIRVLLADDHPVVLHGLSSLLSAAPHITIVGVATSFDAVATYLVQQAIDVLVLDLGGMGDAPLLVVSRLLDAYPALAILIFSSSVDFAPELLNAGVHGYVAKEDLTDHLIAGIEAVARNQAYVSDAVQTYLDAHAAQLQHQLSPRELQVLAFLAHGLGTAEISEQLGIDPRTVQNYITTLRRKLGCGERTQLVERLRNACVSSHPPRRRAPCTSRVAFVH